MKLLTVAQLQTRVYAQKETNLSLLDGLFCQAKDAGADMICLPEMFSCPYETPNFPVYAEPGGGPSWQTLSGLAERYQVYLSAGNPAAQDEAPADQKEDSVQDERPAQDEPPVSEATVSAANSAQVPFATLTLTEDQAGSLLDAYTPEEQSSGKTVYRLDSAAYVQLKCALIATGSLPDTEELSQTAPEEQSDAFALVIVTTAQ